MRLPKTIVTLGARGVLMLLGGAVTLAATTCGAYGSPACREDKDCARSGYGTRCNQELGWCTEECTSDEKCSWMGICDPVNHYCTRRASPDVGTPPQTPLDGGS